MELTTGAAGGLAVRWLGHATVLLELDGVRVLTDPVVRHRLGPLLRHAPAVQPAWYGGVDAVLISHSHHDHLDLPSLRRLGPGVRLVVPRGAGRWVRSAGFGRVEELEVGESLPLEALTVRGVPANHSGFRRPFGPLAAALGYLVEGTHRVYFAGDTDLFAGMAQLGERNLDLALLPVGGWGPTLGPGHLDAHRAAHALRLLRPSMAVPIHWGTFWPIGVPRVPLGPFHRPGQAFVAYAAAMAPLVDVRLLTPGAVLRLEPRPAGKRLG